MLVYHGSIVRVEKPMVKAGRANLDFGRGFYVTNIREQAIRWAKRLGVQMQETSLLNIYDFDMEHAEDDYRKLKFENYDRDWLDFIVSSRNGEQPWMGYDFIEGGVANDRIIDTIEAYISGLTTVEKALGQLAQHRPNNQICLLNQELVEQYLQFRGVESL